MSAHERRRTEPARKRAFTDPLGEADHVDRGLARATHSRGLTGTGAAAGDRPELLSCMLRPSARDVHEDTNTNTIHVPSGQRQH